MAITNKNFHEIVNGSFPKLQVLWNIKVTSNIILYSAINLSEDSETTQHEGTKASNKKYKLLAAIDEIRREKQAFRHFLRNLPGHPSPRKGQKKTTSMPPAALVVLRPSIFALNEQNICLPQ